MSFPLTHEPFFRNFFCLSNLLIINSKFSYFTTAHLFPADSPALPLQLSAERWQLPVQP